MYFEHLTELNFSYNGFKSFPLDLVNQKKLRALSLANNSIPSISIEFFDAATELRYLDLSDNEITAIPAAIRRLEGKLFHLSLANNPRLEKDRLRSVLCGLTNLVSLNLAGTGRSESSLSELRNLSKLTYLDLSNNALSSVPEALFELNNLKHLKLNKNKISSFTVKKDSSVSELTSLNLSHNKLEKLDESIGCLVKLENFYISNNKLSALPASFGFLKELHCLYINSNTFCEFPLIITHCSKLVELHMCFNLLTRVPPDIYWLTELEVFSTFGNVGLTIPPYLCAHFTFSTPAFSPYSLGAPSNSTPWPSFIMWTSQVLKMKLSESENRTMR
ncbi:protein flightless-1 homolog [Zophobas morio]|uniref:protein flightless-1 homolog n=1 Tax=Zophobas morio TaxID=2755281 RepID=UPI003082FB78